VYLFVFGNQKDFSLIFRKKVPEYFGGIGKVPTFASAFAQKTAGANKREIFEKFT
jgi:hypothetical protein